MYAWRLVKAQHAGTAFSGEGAMRFGGRWNSRGERMVYTSDSAALAALEVLVHRSPAMPQELLSYRVEFAPQLVVTLTAIELPAGWRSEPPAGATQRIGDAWIRSQQSVVLSVPSVIIPSERNLLINPEHRDFAKIQIVEPEIFKFDPRLLD